MSNPHQYEISYNYRDAESHFHSGKVLVWAYTVQEACFQLELTVKGIVVTKAGPVTDTICRTSYPMHYHVCMECQTAVPCTGCEDPVRSDLPKSCYMCESKKPHQHFCSMCQAQYTCTYAACGVYAVKDVPCTKHTSAEKQAFFEKIIEEEARRKSL